MDRNWNEKVDRAELLQSALWNNGSLPSHPWKPGEKEAKVDQFLSLADTDQSGSLDFAEFLKGTGGQGPLGGKDG